MITIGPALQSDIADLVELETGLFREDAGTHERFADVTWPEREARDDFEQLIRNPSATVLAAREQGAIVGFAVGYLQQSSPTRLPVTYGALRSLYVDPASRNAGIGCQITRRVGVKSGVAVKLMVIRSRSEMSANCGLIRYVNRKRWPSTGATSVVEPVAGGTAAVLVIGSSKVARKSIMSYESEPS